MRIKTLNKPKKRRMDKFKINEISFVDRPAQEPALAAIIKNKGEKTALEKASVDELLNDNFWTEAFDKALPTMKQGEENSAFVNRFVNDQEAKRQFPEYHDLLKEANKRINATNKQNDFVNLQSSSVNGHSHAICFNKDFQNNLVMKVEYASGNEDDNSVHDHKIVVNSDGSYSMTENYGHTHDIDQEQINKVLAFQMTKRVEDFNKQEFTQEQRERLAESGAAMSNGSFPIVTTNDLSNALSAFGRANESERGAVARHIQRRARALNALDMLPEEGAFADALKTMEKKMKELETALAEIDRLTKLSSLTDAQKDYYLSLDEKDGDVFLDKSASLRQTEIDEIKKADEVIFTDLSGREYRKSDDPRLVEIAKERDEDRREVAKLRAEKEDDALTKSAENYQFLKGSLDERKALIKAVNAIEDQEVRKSVFSILDAANKDNAPMFTSIGRRGQPNIDAGDQQEEAQSKLNDLAKARAEKDSINFYDAYDLVTKENIQLTKKAISG